MGSLVVGFVISFLAVLLTQGDAVRIEPVVPLLVIGLPVADTIWVIRRTSRICPASTSARRLHAHDPPPGEI